MPAPDLSQAPVLVLAAGRGTRMGGPKALMHVASRPWWEWQDQRLGAARVPAIWVVSPVVKAAIIGAASTNKDVPSVLVESSPDAPMFESVRAGLEFVRPSHVRGVFVLPVDVPAPATEVWELLMGAGDVAVPTKDGVHGHPIWLSWAFVERHVLPAAPSARLDDLIGPRADYVAVDDPSVTINLNTPDDVRAWEQLQRMA